MKKRMLWKLGSILVMTLVLGFFTLPRTAQETILPFLPESDVDNGIQLGLDLQGGSQLDYKIVIPDNLDQAAKNQLVSGVKEVITKRVDSLGVSQPKIYITEVGDDKHIIVEIAQSANITQSDVNNYLGTDYSVDSLSEDQVKKVTLEKAKATVGKTIQLEFKTAKTTIDENERQNIETEAANVLARVQEGADFKITGLSEEQVNPGKVSFDEKESRYADELPQKIQEVIGDMQPGQISESPIEIDSGFIINADGSLVAEQSLSLLKLVSKSEEVRYDKQVEASQILIAHTDVDGADASITLSKDEAYEISKDLREQLENGADFAKLAQDYSNDDASKENNGVLEEAFVKNSSYASALEDAALEMQAGDISEVIETSQGYHILKANKVAVDVIEPKYSIQTIDFSLAPDMWESTGLTGANFVNATVQANQQSFQPYVQIQFDSEGAAKFRELTAANQGKQIAIFVGGELVSAPRVNEIIPNGIASITGDFNLETASALARDLNTGAIPAPIVLAGEYTIGASIGHSALSDSVNAGLIGILLVMIFMFAYYKKPGLIANAALIIYGVILIFLIKSSISLTLALVISLAIFGAMVHAIMRGHDSGWDKFISFVLSCIGLYFLTFVLSNKITLDLAGVAGLILSIGMAVDANILIFERIKEELRSGEKTLNKAIETGFDRAWTAIRDSNFSTLFTCAILYTFGTNLIQGFAFNLAAGVLVSMFTAITITKTLIRAAYHKSLNKKESPFGKIKEVAKVKYIKKSKTFFSISSALVIVSIILALILPKNWGIDFTGGSLIQMNFDEQVTVEQISEAFMNAENAIKPASTPVEETDEESISAVPSEGSITELDFSSLQILPAENNEYIVKAPYITPEQLTQIEAELNKELPSFTIDRFTTIGATVGKDLLQNSLAAILWAIVMIVLYVSFAFRKVPASVNKWKFGASAIFALIHDVIIVTGVFIFLGTIFDVTIDAFFVTAMLTVFGYSVNDTIVVLDRLRENLTQKGNSSLEAIADRSMNETMTRSLNTSLSTLFTLIAILILGSSSIFYFILALTLGVVVGTYSSIFIATPLLVKWKNK